MAFTGYAQYKEEVSEQWAGHFTKNSVTLAGTTAVWCNSWTAAPDAGVNPTATARACNYLTAGSLIPQGRKVMNPAALTPYWLIEMELQIAAPTSRTNAGCVMLMDRLADILPSATTNATVTPIANLALTNMTLGTGRHSDGRGVMAALMCTTAISGSPVINITYTNRDGVAGKVSQNVATGAATQFTIIPIPLADGDTGIRSIQSYNIVTAGTSGQFALVLYKPIATFAQPSNSDLPGYREMWEGGAITRLYPDACFELLNINNTSSTTSGLMVGRLGITET